MESRQDSLNTTPICDPERLGRVFERAKEIFMDSRQAEEWLNTSNAALGDKPVALLVSEAGETAVVAALNSIEYGGVA